MTSTGVASTLRPGRRGIGLRTVGYAAVIACLPAAPPASGPHAGAAPKLTGTASVWPVPQPEVLAEFNAPIPDWLPGHRGLDLAARPGDVVRSSRPGVIAWAGNVAGVPIVVVAHGATRATYQPLTTDILVGREVSAGARIGRVARGGHCDNTCLHWGLKSGSRYLDPRLLVSLTHVVLRPVEH